MPLTRTKTPSTGHRTTRPADASPIAALPPAVLSIKNAARYIGCSERQMGRYLAAGDIKSIHLTARLVRILRTELDRFLAEQAAKDDAGAVA